METPQSEEKKRTIKVPIESHFAGDYRLEYDGKYITLFGKDKTYPTYNPFVNDETQVEYEEMVLVSCVEEVRKVIPEITKVDDKYIYITLNPNP